MSTSQLFRRNIAIPQDHGSWVFLFSPLSIGLFAGGNFSTGSLALSLAAVTAFLVRQPITISIKAYSGRRPRTDLPAAFAWIAIYSVILTIASLLLIYLGFGFVFFLVIPGILVFSWHLYLVSRRNERQQEGVEIIATGVLALTAPAAYWVSLGSYQSDGWWLWVLTWLQSAASIIHAYMRLAQRSLTEIPSREDQLRMGRRALLYTTFNLCLTLGLSFADILPRFIFVPYVLQWGETLWGTFNPAVGLKPTKIGIRQLAISTIFTVLFILVWR